MKSREIRAVAHIETAFPTKFGIPRQSGMVDGLRGRIVFEPEYRSPEALRGLEGFSHVWLLWDFSEVRREEADWQPTVRPPRLGGNRRMGVWATRSPFRPNGIGLSSARIVSLHLHTPDGPVIEVSGVDLADGTPIFDIKPYLPFTDCHPDASGGFAEEQNRAVRPLDVRLSHCLCACFDNEQLDVLRQVLSLDPRPHYHADPLRVYVMPFAGREVKFRVADETVTAWVEQDDAGRC